MTVYAETQELRGFFDIKDDLDDDLLASALGAASRWIDGECDRTFGLDDLAASAADPALARHYFGGTCDLRIDDYDPATAITVKLDVGGDGTFETTLTETTNYFRLPLNPKAGHPQQALRRIGDIWPCTATGMPTVQVVARWGWPEIPEPVKQACLIQAADIFKNKDNPFGVAGFGDYGAVRIRANATVSALLFDYRARRTLIG